MMPKISCIIITFNEEKCLPHLLNSLKKQTYKNFEIIVSDNNSKDKTRQIARSFGCKIVQGGLPAIARNNGAKHAKSDLLIFFDADTTLHKNLLKEILKEFNYRNLDVAGVNLVPITDSKFDKLLHKVYNLWQILIQKIDPHLSGACIIIKKKVFSNIGGFDESLMVAEDHALARKAKKKKYKFGILHNYIFLDIRRLKKEGNFKFTFKLMFFWFRRLFGEIKKSKVKYDLNAR